MRIAAELFLVSALASAGPRYSSHGNIVQIGFPNGRIEFEWLGAASFRIAFDWGPARAVVPSTTEQVDYRVSESPASLTLQSKYLAVQLDMPDLTLQVRTREGALLAADAAGPTRAPGKIVLERRLANGERVYGLGHSRPRSLDVRGLRLATTEPFFFTTEGYGMSLAPGAKYLFDVGATTPDRLRITAQGSDRFEYWFYYGPTPKEIFEQRRAPGPDVPPLPAGPTLCDDFRALNAAALSGVLRAHTAAFPPRTPQWAPFLAAYDREVEDRGMPIVHPLVLQFPRDPNAHAKGDVIMLGDELLAAPKCAGAIELPQGVWTDLDTGREYKGHTQYEPAADLSMLARNGSIVPQAKGNVIELHYFPKLGGEFFIYEPDLGEYTQVHAAPAGDFWRLEIESKIARTYEWVVHRPGRSSFRVRAAVKAGQDHIDNIPSGITEGP